MTERSCRVCGLTKPLIEFEKHKKGKSGHTNRCMPCRNEYLKGYYKKNKDKIVQTQVKSLKKRRSEGQDDNKPQRDYAKRNPHYQKFYARQREAHIKRATPDWLSPSDREDMKKWYLLRDKMSEKFGCEYHVDHIVPLRGENVCGLNVPWNLQILEKSLNLSKRNIYD